MNRTHFFLPAVTMAASLLSLDGASVARADDNDTCLAAYEKAQRLRKDGKLGASRDELALCVQPKCHALIKRDCSRWMTELERVAPTVIVNARDAQGKDVLDVRVTVDGVLLLDRLDGKPHELDPGVHVFRYEGDKAVLSEERVVIREGEKNRIINVRLGATEPALPPRPTKPAETPAPPPPVSGYVLLGVAAAGATAFGVLAALGQRDLDDMRKGCAPRCDESDVNAARTKIVVANVSLGVGLVAAGAGAYVLLRPRRAPSGWEASVRSAAGGAAAVLGYRF